MDLKNILAYQAIDAKLFEIESALASDPNRRKCNSLNQTAKNSQALSQTLEQQAESILREMKELSKTIETTKKKGEEILAQNPEEMSKDEVESSLILKDKVVGNLNLLDKRLSKLAENINSVLIEFNKTIKLYNQAKEQYQACKNSYDKKAAEAEPKISALKAELANLRKNVEPTLMQKYDAKRADKIFPVLVKLDGNTCGRCRMELSASAINKIKEDKILMCEHCRRIIYFD